MTITQGEKLVFLAKGKEVEERFAKLFRDAEATSTEEDMHDHVDLKISIGVDIKGLKKVKRNDQEINEHIHWVELKSVQGKPGWLYAQAPDFFVFELKEYWVVVAKEDLQKLIAEKCVEKIKTETPALYKLYQRKGRKDIITMVTSYDLCYVSTSIFKK